MGYTHARSRDVQVIGFEEASYLHLSVEEF
jgi:hypothetical protein